MTSYVRCSNIIDVREADNRFQPSKKSFKKTIDKSLETMILLRQQIKRKGIDYNEIYQNYRKLIRKS